MKVMWVVIVMVMLSGCAEFIVPAASATLVLGVGILHNKHSYNERLRRIEEQKVEEQKKSECAENPKCDPETLNPNKPISVQGLKDSAEKFTTGIGRLIDDPSIVFEGAGETTEDKKQETGE